MRSERIIEVAHEPLEPCYDEDELIQVVGHVGANSVCNVPFVLNLLACLYLRKSITGIILRESTFLQILIFKVSNVLNYLRDENLFVDSVQLGSTKFWRLELFRLTLWALYNDILINIYHNISSSFWIIKEKLIRCSSYKARILLEQIQFTEVENWDEVALVIEDLEW